MEQKFDFAAYLGERLVENNEWYVSTKEAYDKASVELPEDTAGSVSFDNWDQLREELYEAEMKCKSLREQMRELVEEVTPGRFDAIELTHSSGIIDYTQMVNMWVEAVQKPPSSEGVNLPEGLG